MTGSHFFEFQLVDEHQLLEGNVVCPFSIFSQRFCIASLNQGNQENVAVFSFQATVFRNFQHKLLKVPTKTSTATSHLLLMKAVA